jgi:hypothetical protein
MLSLESTLILSRALKRSVQVPWRRMLLSNFNPSDTVKWQDVNTSQVFNTDPYVVERSDRDDSYFGYSTSGVRIVRRKEGSRDPLPLLQEGDILLYTLVNGLKATEEIKEMRATRVKFLEGEEGLERLDHLFMKDCISLREVCFGNFKDLKSIGYWMFAWCTSLVHVSFKGLNSLETIDGWIFHRCTSLVKISFQGLDSLNSIGDGMFYGCTSLVKISFEGLNGLESIGDEMLTGCTSLVEVSFEGLDNLNKIGKVHFKKGDYLRHMLQMEVFKGVTH